MIDLTKMSLREKLDLLKDLEALAHQKAGRAIDNYFNTPEVRAAYSKQIEFINAGAHSNQRLFLGANRTGKTVVGGFEIVMHATGRYPDWWEGRRFDKPVDIWVAGDISKTVRDIIQFELLGDADSPGTGMIPRDSIGHVWKAVGTAAYLDSYEVKHISGGMSRIQQKSYDQGRKAFQGTKKDIIWLDEECPEEVYQECLLRTMTTNGLMVITFTPLMGMTPLVQQFLKAEPDSGRVTVRVTWDDVPHLSEEMKKQMYASLPPHQRDARSRGIPQLGAGAIYPVPITDFMMAPIEIPKHWKRLFALDVGWNNTAVLWMAIDPESLVGYIYSEHKQGEEKPLYHADAIKGRGKWIPGVIDPAARGRGQDDGQRLMDQYKEQGLELTMANNAVEAGIYSVWTALSTGKLKVFSSCVKFFDEFNLYHRNEKGAIVKTNDHLMDCMRYLWNTRDKADFEISKTINTEEFYQVSLHNRTSI